MRKSSTYSISIDGVSKRGLKVQGLRVRLPGEAGDSYLLLASHMPRGDAQTVAMFIAEVLDAADKDWRKKLLAITVDGCSTNMGRKNGVIARLRRLVGRSDLIVVWCGAHQVDLVLGEIVEALHFDEGGDGTLRHWVSVCQNYYDKGGALPSRPPCLKDVRW
eukprot:GHVU01150429.1.p2 GENE.GHVU01150429.1~~GHVU01150429.1.p2  ORF type:complete len:162 (+),score=15.94 GHVU01150429.1:1139-1624(+)